MPEMLDALGRPMGVEAPAPAPPPAQPAPNPWQMKEIAARQAGATDDQIDMVREAKYREANKAGATDDQIAMGFGFTPGTTQTAQIMARLRAGAITNAKEPGVADLLGDTFHRAWDTLQAGVKAATSFTSPGVSELQEDVHAQQAGGAAAVKKGTADFNEGAANPIFGIPEQLYGGAEIAMGAGQAALATPLGWIDTIAGRPVQAATAGLPSHKFGTIPNYGGTGRLPVEFDPQLPRQFVSNAAMNLLPFLHAPAIPAELGAEYIASGLAPGDFMARQKAMAGPVKATAEQIAAATKLLPHPTEFRDGAITVAGVKADPAFVIGVRQSLEQHWLKTGEAPLAAAQRAQTDPVFRQQLLTGALRDPPAAPRSARADLMGSASSQTTRSMGAETGDINETGTTVRPNLVLPRTAPPALPTWPLSARQTSLLPPEGKQGLDDWVAGKGEAINDAYSANPSPAGLVLASQLEAGVGPVRAALTKEHGPVMTLYRPDGKVGNVASFTPSKGLALQLAGGDETKLVTTKVPVGDVVWATDEQGHQEVLVHVGDKGVPASLSEKAPPTDVLQAGGTPKPRVGATPIPTATHPLAVLENMRQNASTVLSGWFGGARVAITSDFRTEAQNAALPNASRTSEHLFNAAWDFHVSGKTTEEAGLELATKLRGEGIAFDQIEITPTHTHIGFKPDGVGNRSEIIYRDGAKPGAAAHGIKLSGDPSALAEGELAPEATTPALPEEKPAAGLASIDVPPVEDEAIAKGGKGPALPEKEDEEAGDITDAEAWEKGTPTLEQALAEVRGAEAPVEKPQNWVARLADLVQTTYRQILNPSHPTQLLMRAAEEGGRMLGESNPEYLQRIAEYAPDKAKYTIERNMIDLKGNVIGPGFKAILARVDALPANGIALSDYAKAKWTLEQAKKGAKGGGPRKVPISVAAAQMVVDAAEKDGVHVPYMTPHEVAAKYGIPIEVHPENSAMMRRIGPHYTSGGPNAGKVFLSDLADPFVEEKYGPGLTAEAVAAHEVGHALAFKWAPDLPGMLGRGVWDHLDPEQVANLEDELNIVSRQFKPGLWADKGQRGHVTKNSELIADGIATWMTDPSARFRMPELYSLLGSKLEELGGIPDQWGTPVQQAFTELVHYQNQSLAWLRDSGIIARESYVHWVAENAARIPGYRDMSIAAPAGGTPPRGITAYNPIREARGSEVRLQNVFQSILRDVYQRRILAERNIATQATLSAAGSVGYMGKIAANKLLTFKLDPLELAKLGADETLDATFSRMVGSDLRPGEVPVFFNGKFEKWGPSKELSEGDTKLANDLVTQLRGMDEQSLAAWQKIVAPATNFLRKSVTINPLFPLKILNYDITMQAMTNPDVRNSLTQMFMGIGHVFGNSALFDDAMRKGVFDHTFDGLSREPYIRDVLKDKADPGFLGGVWNIAKTPYELASQFGRAMGKVAPMGRYAQATPEERLLSPNRTAYQMSEAPFHRVNQGGAVGKNINATTPFFLAHLIGLEKTLRAAIGVPKPGLPKVNPLQFYGMGAVVAAVSVTSYLANKDQDWYKALPNWQKDGLLWAHVGEPWEHTGRLDAQGQEIIIPHGVTMPIWYWPPLISILFSAFPRRLAADFIAHDPSAMDGLVASGVAGLAPPGGTIAASIFTPVVEGAFNKSFVTGRPLISDDEKAHLGTTEQYTPYTTGTAKALSQLAAPLHLGASPVIIDNYIKDWAGPMGQQALHAVDASARGLGLERNKEPSPSPADWPLIGSWLTRTPGSSTQPIEDARTISQSIDQVHGSLEQAMKEDDFGKFSRILAANPSAAVTRPFDIHGVAPPANEQQYSDALQAASDKAADKLQPYLEAEAAIKGEEKVIKFIWSLPTHNPHPEAGAEDHSNLREGDATQYSYLSANDKRQLLDQYYATIQVMSEAAVKRAHEAGLK